jgi:hypothetical protein
MSTQKITVILTSVAITVAALVVYNKFVSKHVGA